MFVGDHARALFAVIKEHVGYKCFCLEVSSNSESIEDTCARELDVKFKHCISVILFCCKKKHLTHSKTFFTDSFFSACIPVFRERCFVRQAICTKGNELVSKIPGGKKDAPRFYIDICFWYLFL